MTTGSPGPYSQTPYKLVTSDIESVDAFSFTETNFNASYGAANIFDGDTATEAFGDGTNNAVPFLQEQRTIRVYFYELFLLRFQQHKSGR